MNKTKITCKWLSVVLLVITVFAVPAIAGNLNPSAPPAPTMKTLDEIPPPWSQKLTASNRFVLVLDGQAVLDKETGIVWEQSPEGTCNNLGGTCDDWYNAHIKCNRKTVGGRKGWRLPTIQELASLIDPSVPYPGPMIPIGHPFSNVQRYFYWSATNYVGNTNLAWMVDFTNGFLSYPSLGKTLLVNVWCVRGGPGSDEQ